MDKPESLESLESQMTKALDRLAELLDAYHALTQKRDQSRKPGRAYAVADVLAASLARHDIRRASARADALVREYLDLEDEDE